jgi:hypothetical protein
MFHQLIPELLNGGLSPKFLSMLHTPLCILHGVRIASPPPIPLSSNGVACLCQYPWSETT